jgi:CheY-like chemotaxis protein
MSGRRRSGWRRFSCEPFEIGEPDLDERAYGVLESGRAGDLERLLVALAHLVQRDALLEPVVARQQQLLDLRARTVLHPRVRYSLVRVLIADDEPLFAEALKLLLSADERIEVVGRAADGSEAVELARKLEPDLVLMDLSMPGIDGFGATEQIAAALDGVRVLVLTGSEDPADVAKARKAGASGYITKDQIAETLVDAILEAGTDGGES